MSIIILLRLLAAHLIADFLLQPSGWVKSKNDLKWRSPHLYVHVLVHGAATYLFLGIWDNYQVPLIVMGSHLLIDLGKASLRWKNLYTFIADQVLHLAVLTGCWLALTGQGAILAASLRELLANPAAWVLLTGYLLVLFPAGVVISIATRKWCQQLEDRQGLAEAGKWIGYSERFLILTFILLSRYEAIGFLIAAKSVFRFNEIMKDKERKEAEYFLIGTLLSISFALAAGLLTKSLL
ncbi:uncharacterized protein DUF3307 [Anseongella ginsenosidimutans]|uniref:Uncharacterized protein DUF3307 n=1 Tax=Anseongella ginsenosidimutans TaxID=496056 RepID=A0A4R3KUA8_9SPHI|nr:DUF3307 domain-containing protein [Anseongella ginsenosidimutans]QEC52981.1 DUF3307 domain-containing protein [Anseongella ginsenosidimutans]TCS87385.1 uncharacterized protein DUF3307 [Anseongella ginsenosidimutans]